MTNDSFWKIACWTTWGVMVGFLLLAVSRDGEFSSIKERKAACEVLALQDLKGPAVKALLTVCR